MREGSAVEHGLPGAPGEGEGGRGYLWAWTALSVGPGAYSEGRLHQPELRCLSPLPWGRPFCCIWGGERAGGRGLWGSIGFYCCCNTLQQS